MLEYAKLFLQSTPGPIDAAYELWNRPVVVHISGSWGERNTLSSICNMLLHSFVVAVNYHPCSLQILLSQLSGFKLSKVHNFCFIEQCYTFLFTVVLLRRKNWASRNSNFYAVHLYMKPAKSNIKIISIYHNTRFCLHLIQCDSNCLF